MKDMIQIIKGCLLGVMLVVSTITVFFSDGIAYWNDMAFIVWCLTIVITIDMFDKKRSS
jgi:hypothetical protein